MTIKLLGPGLGVCSNKCENCYYFQTLFKWVNVPFRFGGTSRKGIDCFSVSLRIVQEAGYITSKQFKEIHTARTLRVLRKEGRKSFEKLVLQICAGRLVLNQESLKCGDWVIHYIGKNFDVESALYVGGRFITSVPNLCVQIKPNFSFDFAITWGGFTFKEIT